MSGFSGRLLEAVHALERATKVRTIENSEIGRRVAKRMGRKKAYTSQSVGKWLDGTEPGLDVIEALAAELGVDPGWLAFDGASGAPAPVWWDVTPPDEGDQFDRAGGKGRGQLPPGEPGSEDKAG